MDIAHSKQNKTYYFTKSQMLDMRGLDVRAFLIDRGFDKDKPMWIKDDICGRLAWQEKDATS